MKSRLGSSSICIFFRKNSTHPKLNLNLFSVDAVIYTKFYFLSFSGILFLFCAFLEKNVMFLFINDICMRIISYNNGVKTTLC